MLITHVELSDFKSYAHEVIAFPMGTNAIVGDNGSGKSSILEAIGLALFDYHDDVIASYLREGAREGSVIVGFISSDDEREYEVERRFGKSSGRYRVYDVALGRQPVAEGPAEVRQWLHRHLHVEPNDDLGTLFRNTVGVPQGTVTGAFLGTAAERKAIFDPLLQVAEYDRAWSSLAETASYLSAQMNQIENRLARLRGLTERLPSLCQEQVTLDDAVCALNARLAALSEALQQMQAEMAALDTLERSVRDLAQQTEQYRTRLEAQFSVLEAAERDLREAGQAVERLAAARGGHEAYLAAEAALASQEERRSERDQLLAAQAQNRSEAARLAARLEQFARDLVEVSASERSLAELMPAVEQQNGLEASLGAARLDVQRLAEAERRVRESADELAHAQQDLDDKTARWRQAGALEQALTTLDQQMRLLDQSRLDAQEQEAHHKAELARLREQLGALEDASLARCPVCEAELTPAHRAELLAQNAARQSDHDAALADLGRRLRGFTTDVAGLRAQRQQFERQLRALPSDQDLAQARADAERRHQAWQQSAQAAQGLADAPPRLHATEAALEALGNPRQAAAQHQAIAQRRPALEREQAQMLTDKGRADAARATIEEQLAAYQDLDEAMRATRAERDYHREAHGVYLAQQRAAEQRPARAARVQSVADEIAALKVRLAQAQAEHEAAVAAYRAQRHAEVKAQVSAGQKEAAALEAQSLEKRGRLGAVKREVGELESMLAEVAQQESVLRETLGLHKLVVRVRELLKRAGPEVTRQRVRRISLEASALHAEIVGDHRNRLIWAQDYALSLEVKGLERSFRQFSGGEQMAAALALRLALLRDASHIDVAFFDEPTAHLDPERRANLAEQIMKVKGFSQLFVISHDDSFEQLAQNHVRIVKDESGSHWEKS